MENILIFSEVQIKKINKKPLAEKYECSSQYIGQVLRGKKGKGKKGKQIRTDAKNFLKILGDPLMEIEVIEPEILTA